MRNALHLATTLLLLVTAACAAEDGSDGEPGTGTGAGIGKADGEDAYLEARNVDLAAVHIAAEVAPSDYAYPETEGFSLSGTEFWQKWSGGHNPTYSYDEGTDLGRKCMLASAIRFEAIMADPPASLVELRDMTNWEGSFYNWNDDYTQSTWGDASAARLWAWRTHLIKWISQTGKDGTCYLPTRALVERAATACLATAAGANGEIQGCSVTAE